MPVSPRSNTQKSVSSPNRTLALSFTRIFLVKLQILATSTTLLTYPSTLAYYHFYTAHLLIYSCLTPQLLRHLNRSSEAPQQI